MKLPQNMWVGSIEVLESHVVFWRPGNAPRVLITPLPAVVVNFLFLYSGCRYY